MIAATVTSRRKSEQGLVRDRKGAVYVEFLATFLPITIVFLGLAQSAGLYSAKLITAHAAVVGARAAAVVIPDDPKHYDDSEVGEVSGKRKQAIERAVGMTLKANGSIIGYSVEVEGADGQAKQKFAQSGSYQQATVRVKAIYMCSLSVASYIVCGSFFGITDLEETASMPIHMASYPYPE
jgi:Flp pilus assembly protein TadG